METVPSTKSKRIKKMLRKKLDQLKTNSENETLKENQKRKTMDNKEAFLSNQLRYQ